MSTATTTDAFFSQDDWEFELDTTQSRSREALEALLARAPQGHATAGYLKEYLLAFGGGARFTQFADATQSLPDDELERLRHYEMTRDEAHEASQGAFIQAAWLEERANNEPDPHKRRELRRRAYMALGVAKRLQALS